MCRFGIEPCADSLAVTGDSAHTVHASRVLELTLTDIVDEAFPEMDFGIPWVSATVTISDEEIVNES